LRFCGGNRRCARGIGFVVDVTRDMKLSKSRFLCGRGSVSTPVYHHVPSVIEGTTAFRVIFFTHLLWGFECSKLSRKPRINKLGMVGKYASSQFKVGFSKVAKYLLVLSQRALGFEANRDRNAGVNSKVSNSERTVDTTIPCNISVTRPYLAWYLS
jgi:hypothetical protein